MAEWRNALALFLFVSAYALANQSENRQAANPEAGSPTAIREGESLFRANCSPCHGLQACGGARGPDLTSGRWIHGDLFTGAPQKYHEGHDFLGSIYVPAPGERGGGALKAFDPFTGEEKWAFPCAAVYSSPIAFSVEGRQYVAIPAGAALFAFALPSAGL